MIVPIILCGGVGTRLWPRSRDILPKQFLNLADNSKTLLQQTLLRVANRKDFDAPIILCGIKHKALLQENCKALGIEPMAVLFEPFGKNTAPAIAAAAEWLKQHKSENSLMLVLPADHHIVRDDDFIATVRGAAHAAESGKLITFAIAPSYPATGYGYIERGELLEGEKKVFKVSRFIEKPDLQHAKTLTQDDRYAWNSGMFMMTAKAYIEELTAFEPDIMRHAAAALKQADNETHYYLLNEKEFGQCADQSIDYGIMERTDKAAVAPLNVAWNDVGSWQAVYDLASKDADGNSLQGDVTVHDSNNCYAQSEHGMLALVGVDNLVVVATQDAVLVANKDRTEEVKQLVNMLRKAKRKEFYQSPRVYRPWGYYEDLQEGVCFRVKRLCVNPGQKLSLQFHRQRAEHWVVVSGIATVTRGEEVYPLASGESTYINVGQHHRLENKHTTPLEIIEVQIGSYVGEDDIVRLEDIYGRLKPGLT